jgi:hypothetical protein
MLLLKEILDPKYGMFKEYEETRSIWFSEDTFEDQNMYFLIGKEYVLVRICLNTICLRNMKKQGVYGLARIRLKIRICVFL